MESRPSVHPRIRERCEVSGCPLDFDFPFRAHPADPVNDLGAVEVEPPSVQQPDQPSVPSDLARRVGDGEKEKAITLEGVGPRGTAPRSLCKGIAAVSPAIAVSALVTNVRFQRRRPLPGGFGDGEVRRLLALLKEVR